MLRIRCNPARAVAVLIAVALALPIAFAVGGRATRQVQTDVSQRAVGTRTEPAFAVERARLDERVVRALDALGSRFEVEALGRTVILETLTRHGGGRPETARIRIVRELPDLLRFEEQRGAGARVLGYDGSCKWGLSGEPTEVESALAEMLVRDSVEHFVAGQAAGNATQVLGERFRADDGTDPNYDGPYFEVLRVFDAFRDGGRVEQRPTLYYLNSRTGLPERLVYERGGGGRVEVEFSDWAEAAGQRFPRRVTRREGGELILELRITQAAFVPAARDGSFDAPTAR